MRSTSKKYLSSLLTVLFLISQVLGVFPIIEVQKAFAIDEVVSIPDPNLQAAIRTALNKPTGDITKTDMLSLTTLNGNNLAITSLVGLEYAENLNVLKLNNNNISDLAPLSNLYKLSWLYLSDNKIKDLNPLKNLVNLFYLELMRNQITDINPIENKFNLVYLYLHSNQITDISSIKNLNKLSYINLNYNKIVEISALTNLTQLKNINLDGNNINDLTPLNGHTQMSSLSVRSNPLWSTALPVIQTLQSRGTIVAYDPIDTTPPVLIITSPTYNSTPTSSNVTVSGITEPGSTVKINDTTIDTNTDGTFSSTYTLSPGLNTINITSTDAAQNTITETRTIFYDSTIPVDSVSLDNTNLSLNLGESYQLTATINPADATNKNITWSSSNPIVARVDQTGKVSALSAGSATITVITEYGGKTATCEVTVKTPNSGTLITGEPTTNIDPVTNVFNINSSLNIGFELASPAKVTATIFDNFGQPVKTIANNVSKTAGSVSISWDGRNSSGVKVPPSYYSYLVEVVDSAGNKEQFSDSFMSSRSPIITDLTTLPITLTNNNPSANIKFKFDMSSTKVRLGIYNSKGALVRTLVNTENKDGGKEINWDPIEFEMIWDGIDDSGNFVGDGVYSYRIDAADAATGVFSAIQRKGNITVEKTAPALELAGFSQNPYNMRSSLTVTYKLSEDANVKLDIINSANEVVRSYTMKKYWGINYVSWDGKNTEGQPVNGGIYNLVFTLVDNATNTVITKPYEIKVSKTPILTLDAPPALGYKLESNDRVVTLGYNLDIANGTKADVNIAIYNKQNILIRTITNEALSGGSFTAIWDGKDNTGKFVDDGVYSIRFNATDQVAGFTSSQKTETIVVEKNNPQISNITLSQNPYNMRSSLAIGYTLQEASNVTIEIKEKSGISVRKLLTDTKKYAGPNNISWDGKNDIAEGVKGGEYYAQITTVDSFGKTVTTETPIFKASKIPVATYVSEGSNVYIANEGELAKVNYQVDTATDTKANVTVAIYNKQGTLIKTITDALLGTGGYTAEWDGKDTTGTYVGDGVYTYKINTVDPIAGFVGVQRSGSITVESKAPTIENITFTREPYNPSNGSQSIGYTLSEDSLVTVKIYEIVNGTKNLVRNVVTDYKRNAGLNSTSWDGKNSAAQLVPGGLYEVEVTAKDFTQPLAKTTVLTKQIKVVRLDSGEIKRYNDYDLGINGYQVSFNLQGWQASEVSRIDVKLYKGITILATNSTKNLLTNDPNLSQIKTTFDVDGSYTDDNWYYGKWTAGLEQELPDKVVITVTDKNNQIHRLEVLPIIVTPQ